MPKDKYNAWPWRRMTLAERLEGKRVYIPGFGCWYWGGHLDRDGYAKIHVGDRPRMAHRVAYELARGPIPDGMVIDHLCRNRECTNPAHMELVRSRENTMRSPVAPASVNSKMTHCREGHLLVEVPAHYKKRQRFCPTCRNRKRG